MTLAALVRAAIALLERVRVPYMVTGSVASSYHGEPRATRDLDIVIDPGPAELDRLVDEIALAGLHVDRGAARRALADRGQFNAIEAESGWKIDFILRRDRRFSRAEFGRRASATLLGTPAWIASAEDTIVAKLEWATATGSDRQLADAAAMLDIGGSAVDIAYVEQWVAELGLHDAWDRARALRSAG